MWLKNYLVLDTSAGEDLFLNNCWNLASQDIFIGQEMQKYSFNMSAFGTLSQNLLVCLQHFSFVAGSHVAGMLGYMSC